MNNKTNTNIWKEQLKENNLLRNIKEDVNQQFDELLSSSERFTNEMDSFRIKIESLHEILGSFVEELPSKEIFDGMNELIIGFDEDLNIYYSGFLEEYFCSCKSDKTTIPSSV